MHVPWFGHRRLNISVRVTDTEPNPSRLAELEIEVPVRKHMQDVRRRWEHEQAAQIGWIR